MNFLFKDINIYKNRDKVVSKVALGVIVAYFLIIVGLLFQMLILFILLLGKASSISILSAIIFSTLWHYFLYRLYYRIAYRTVINIKSEKDNLYIECYKKTYKVSLSARLAISSGMNNLLLYIWVERKRILLLMPKYAIEGLQRVSNINEKYMQEFKNLEYVSYRIFDEVFK